MHSTKLLHLVILVLIAAVLSACAAVPAIGADSKSIVIQLVPTGADPDALGNGTLSNVQTTWSRGTWGVSYRGRVRVTCTGLTPGASYEVRTNQYHYQYGWYTWGFKASGSGAGGAGGSVEWSGWTSPLSVSVVRVDETPDGTVYTAVLGGNFPF